MRPTRRLRARDTIAHVSDNETPAKPTFVQPVRQKVPLPPTDPVIRELDPAGDMPSVSAIHRQAHPTDPGDPDYLAYRVDTSPPEARRIDIVAVVDDEIVGYAFTHLDTEADLPGATIAQVMVAERHRGRGVGRALAARLAPHWQRVGSSVVVGRVVIHDSMLFVLRQRFAPSSQQHVSRRELSQPIQVPDAPAGVTLNGPADDGFRGMYHVHTAVTDDIYPDTTRYTPPPFEVWRDKTAADPLLDLDSSIVAFSDGRPAALSWISRSQHQAWSILTGVAPEFRGTGLGYLVKAESLRRARAAGVTEVFTANSDGNAPMLAINRRLGYELHVEQFTVGRMLTQP